jgi:hypothetical protein
MELTDMLSDNGLKDKFITMKCAAPSELLCDYTYSNFKGFVKICYQFCVHIQLWINISLMKFHKWELREQMTDEHLTAVLHIMTSTFSPHTRKHVTQLQEATFFPLILWVLIKKHTIKTVTLFLLILKTLMTLQPVVQLFNEKVIPPLIYSIYTIQTDSHITKTIALLLMPHSDTFTKSVLKPSVLQIRTAMTHSMC